MSGPISKLKIGWAGVHEINEILTFFMTNDIMMLGLSQNKVYSAIGAMKIER